METKINTLLILAGGLGTRFSEKTKRIPKPLIKANNKPLVQYIIDHYVDYGYKKIILLTGYKSNKFENYFKKISSNHTKNIYKLNNDVEIHILNTGIDSLTGLRLLKGIKYISEDFFSFTYGDGVSNVNLNELEKFHFQNNSFLTVTAVRPPARFGDLEFEGNRVIKFNEKNSLNTGWINGGFFISSKKILNYLNNKNESFENEPISRILERENVFAYKHSGYWRPVDTLRELELFEKEIT